MSDYKALIKHLLKKIWISAAVLIVFAAVCSSLFRSFTPLINHHINDMEQELTELVGQPVSIQSIQTGWYWLQPVLKLNHVTIRGGSDALHVEKLFIGINLFKSLAHWRLAPGLLYLEEAHLVARKKDGKWRLDVFSDESSNTSTFSEQMQQIFIVLAQQDRLIIKNIALDLYSEHKRLTPITHLNLSIVNGGGDYKIKGSGRIDQHQDTQFEFLGLISFDPLHYQETQGRIYFSGEQLYVPKWQKFFFPKPHYIKDGLATLNLWVDLNHGRVSSAQVNLSLTHLMFDNIDKTNTLTIPSFSANMAWKPDNKGWKFDADHIKLHLNNADWPENQMSLQYDKAQNQYVLFAKYINIESLRTQIAAFSPTLIKDIEPLKLKGQLSDFQLVIKNRTPTFLLTRFDRLSWKSYKKLPAVSHLSGGIQWEPQEGHLELDSEETSVAFKDYPKQQLTLLNGALDWKELSHGLRLSIDRLAISQPELTISMQGVLDEVSPDSIGAMRMAVEFSAKNIQQWLPYLPQKIMRPKLFHWLNDDIKKIAMMTGKVKINGLAKDFPFDNHNGEFSVVSHATGGELFITPKWQLIKEIEGYFRLNSRNLEIDLVHGDIQGVPLEQMHLRIDDIGQDKETLLLHGLVHGPAQKMLDFILASPVNKQLNKLKMLALKGLFLLDLNVEVPLYPENDDNLVKGTLTFDHNEVVLKHQMVALSIEDVQGTLSFDDLGVTESTLAGMAFDHPLDIKIESSKTPKPATVISILGECTIEGLKRKLNLPILSLFKGQFGVNALFKITADPNELDHLTLNSTLQGLAINVPSPLGKKYKEETPLELNLDFDADKAFRVRGDYDHRLSADILFEQNKEHDFELKSGQISLGSNMAVEQQKPGLDLVGSLEGFNLGQWKSVYDSLASDHNDISLFDKLSHFNLKLDKLDLIQQEFNNMTVKGTVLPNQDWTFNIEQKKISADLTYQAKTDQLSGFVHYAHLDKIKPSRASDSSLYTLKPSQIPNLNLRIDDLNVGDILIGNMTIKSHTKTDRWAIDFCCIDTPAYQFNLGGEWIKNDNSERTNLQLKAHFNNLGQSLEQWKLHPSVDAHKGDMEFNGGWKGAFYDFSLAGLKGHMNLELNNGRITHLSPETEEKLGLGKLLSILSLQTIPRRLKLDFSDLSNDGYSFDVFKGDFDINKGIMHTQNSMLDGPVAYASMKGDLNIVKHLYDMDLTISPHITASLPVVATLAGGPVVGLTAWVATKMINKSMQKITGYSYKISGPWDEPVVQQLNIIKNTTKN